MLRLLTGAIRESTCKLCGERGPLISEALGVCATCIKEKPSEAEPLLRTAHARARSQYGLPGAPPRTRDGIPCVLCSNQCRIGMNETGFCGLRHDLEGTFRALANPRRALVHTYLDPLPTNCCSTWFCPGGTGAGHPRYAVKPSAETGHYNFAVFLYGCNFDCLFCQNAYHKDVVTAPVQTRAEFVEKVVGNPLVSCVCYFGGSPEPQLPFALKASREILEETENRALRICWEWNGCGHPGLVERAAEISLESGGNVKFDLKFSDPNLSLALSGVSNRRAYENFRMIYNKFYEERADLPVLTATTLMVPGYVDATEVENIAKFLADLNPDIPYSLLAFHPSFQMRDLPVTSRKQAEECYTAARKHLRRVNVGNKHLLELFD